MHLGLSKVALIEGCPCVMSGVDCLCEGFHCTYAGKNEDVLLNLNYSFLPPKISEETI